MQAIGATIEPKVNESLKRETLIAKNKVVRNLEEKLSSIFPLKDNRQRRGTLVQSPNKLMESLK